MEHRDRRQANSFRNGRFSSIEQLQLLFLLLRQNIRFLHALQTIQKQKKFVSPDESNL